MFHSSDTPPNGDFAAYVERLTGSKAIVANRENLFAPKIGAVTPTAFSASSGIPSAKAGVEPAKHTPILRHIKWIVGLWLLAQVLAQFVPGTGFLFIGALGLYAAWAFFTSERKPPGTFLRELRERAAHAAGEVKRSSTVSIKNKQ